MTFEEVMDTVRKEFLYQDQRFKNNDKKPMEVWLMLVEHYLRKAFDTYAIASQTEVRAQLVKVIAVASRALMAEPGDWVARPLS